MDFNSPIFLFLFLPIFIPIYYFASRPVKWILGIAGSLLFYAWGNLVYIPLMLGLVILTYYVARGIQHARGERRSAYLLWLTVLVIVAVLVGFKLATQIKFPLGLSYVTFQALAYLFEVYNNKVSSEPNGIKFAFYLLLFPKIPVGPITRYSQLQAQIETLHVESVDVAEGLRRFIVGFAKKVLIADTLAKAVTPIFQLSSPTVLPSVAWLVILGYSLQLYFDFSGYTDMAIGLGRMMGLRFMENFNVPYIAKSIGEFWRRWHISLSSWFRDFVFYPLERRRSPWMRQPVNVLIVFILTGLWHGIALNFILWGLIHGLALVFESTAAGRTLRTLWAPVQHLYALTVIVFGWVFFRSPTVTFALNFLRRLAGDHSGVVPLPFAQTSPWPFVEPSFLLALVAGILFSLPIGQWLERLRAYILQERPALRLAFQVVQDVGLVFILLASIAAMASSAFTPGIYGTF